MADTKVPNRVYTPFPMLLYDKKTLQCFGFHDMSQNLEERRRLKDLGIET